MTADVVPIRRPAPVPLTPTEPPPVDVATLPADHRDPAVSRGARYPARRGIGGHHPDCPYGSHGDPQHCPICQGLAKGQPDRATA